MKTANVLGMSVVLLGIGSVLVLQSRANNSQGRAEAPSSTRLATQNARAKDPKNKRKVPPVLNYTMNNLAGKPIDLASFKGEVVLIVNTASKCGFTSQYAGLQKLHEKYAARGLKVLGFPANDFGQQEPGNDAQIGEFCRANYGVTFPMFSKIAVTGADKAPLYKFLTEASTNAPFAGEVQWNFEKFLVARDGKIVGRFRSGIAPDSDEMTRAIETQLTAKTK